MTLTKNNQNGSYIINKKTGVSLALVLVLAGALTFYFTAQASLEARINTKLELKISKDDHREDMGLLREDLKRIEGKIDRLLERRNVPVKRKR
jgi:hypothetical protein